MKIVQNFVLFRLRPNSRRSHDFDFSLIVGSGVMPVACPGSDSGNYKKGPGLIFFTTKRIRKMWLDRYCLLPVYLLLPWFTSSWPTTSRKATVYHNRPRVRTVCGRSYCSVGVQTRNRGPRSANWKTSSSRAWRKSITSRDSLFVFHKGRWRHGRTIK